MDNADKLIDQYLSLVLEANKRINLTRIDSFEKAQVLHVEDSLLALPEIQNAPHGVCADIGSGGGFPGVPLSIKTGRQTLLVDSVRKKMDVLHSILSQLGLSSQIKTYAGRIENLACEKTECFSVVTARALAQLASLLELSSPLLERNGLLICYKAQTNSHEIDCALEAEELVGMKLVSRRKSILSDQKTHREIFVFEKYDNPKINLPRRVGLAQKRPLCN